MRSAATALVEALLVHGAQMGFCVPGESYLPVLDALHGAAERFQLITCRHEGGAANMAEAYGKLTGRPGICFVTRGPGATHAACGVHTAFQDSTPMILFIGQVARTDMEREAFQEIDYRHMFAPMAKWVAQIDVAERVPEFIARAFATAMSGRPGPVVLALPEDMLGEACPDVPLKQARPSAGAPGMADIEQLAALLARAERPLLMLGGGGWTGEAVRDMRRFIEAFDLPTGTSFRAKDRLDNRHPNYVGDFGIGIDPKLARRLDHCDLLLAVGPRLGEMTTGGYTRLSVPRPSQTLIHVHPGAEELNRVYQADLAINAGIPAFARAIAALHPAEAPRWSAWRREARADYEAFIRPVTAPGAVNPSDLFAYLNLRLPDDAILTNGAGNYAGWAHRFYLHRSYPSQLAPTSGAMGYGVPAAIAAKLVFPERIVVALAGDGCFLMTGQELATAVQYQVPIIVLVFNNGMYGTIRMHQERHFPGRVIATQLHNPNFAALAKSYGAFGARVDATADFEAAFEAALACKGPALIEITIDPEAITSTTTLSAIRAAAQAKG
ncbi:MAG: thiamine pyrophosphate-binding protein [Alphaproteobacteria bacterium]|nr:thiamine pyrophosphate-binding protein [Alphaproteobacteria bacterium]